MVRQPGSRPCQSPPLAEQLCDDDARGRRRSKNCARSSPSKQYRAAYGHTPLSIKEEIPWHCRRLMVATGAQGALPVMDKVRPEATRRKLERLSLPTAEAIAIL